MRAVPERANIMRRDNIRALVGMRRFKLSLGVVCLLGLAVCGFAAEAGHAAAGHAAEGPPVTPAAPTLVDLGQKLGLPFSFPITNAMVYTWVIMAFLFIVIRVGTRRMQ